MRGNFEVLFGMSGGFVVVGVGESRCGGGRRFCEEIGYGLKKGLGFYVCRLIGLVGWSSVLGMYGRLVD